MMCGKCTSNIPVVSGRFQCAVQNYVYLSEIMPALKDRVRYVRVQSNGVELHRDRHVSC